MTAESHHRRFAPVMWGAIGVTFFLLAVVAALRLDPRIAGYAVGALVLTCLLVCVAAFWMDARAEQATARLAERIHHRSTRPSSTSRDVRPV
jgi:hypothetical protein